jgi:hypothetical protein
MAGSTSVSQPHSSCQGHPLRPNLGFNASRGRRPATVPGKTDRPRRKLLATQDEEVQEGKKLRCQNWAKRRERLSALNPELSKALDMKECMLEVQGMLLGKLAVEENRLKGLAETLSPPIANFDERVKEVEEVMRSMQY